MRLKWIALFLLAPVLALTACSSLIDEAASLSQEMVSSGQWSEAEAAEFMAKASALRSTGSSFLGNLGEVLGVVIGGAVGGTGLTRLLRGGPLKSGSNGKATPA